MGPLLKSFFLLGALAILFAVNMAIIDPVVSERMKPVVLLFFNIWIPLGIFAIIMEMRR